MDLSFARFDRTQELHQLPGDLAVLLVGVAARQAASRTAATQARIEGGEAAADRLADAAGDPFAPPDGAFNGPMAEALVRWGKP